MNIHLHFTVEIINLYGLSILDVQQTIAISYYTYSCDVFLINQLNLKGRKDISGFDIYLNF